MSIFSRLRRASLSLIAALLLTVLAPSADAITLSRQDALIIVRSLLMLVPRPVPGATIVVLPTSSSSDALAEAEAAATFLKSSAAKAKAVPLDRLQETKDAVAILVPPGLPADALRALPVGALLIGFDAACVAEDRCILYIRSAGQVSITLNRQMLVRSGLRFDPAFQLLMKEQ